MAVKIQLRRDLSTIWASVNPILSQGEAGLETDTNKIKYGDGIRNWNALPYYSTGSSTLKDVLATSNSADAYDIDMNGNTIYNVADPIGDDEATNKGFVISQIEAKRAMLNAGPLDNPIITYNGGGLVDIGSIDFHSYDNPNFLGTIDKYTVPAITAVQLLPNTYYYIVLDHNSGNPTYSISTDNGQINHSNKFNAGQLIWENLGTINELHVFYTGPYGLGIGNKTSHRLIHTERFGYQSGLMLSEYGTRNVAISSGVIWYDSEEISVMGVASATSGQEIHFYYHTGGNWTASAITQYNNSQYDNGTDLVSLIPNKYAVNWVYKGANGSDHSAFIVLGTGAYSLIEAQASQPPELPPVVSKMGILVGRIIVLAGASTAIQIDSAFSTKFSSAPVISHNETSNIQGGETDQKYHLNENEYKYVNNVQTSTKDYTGFSSPESVVISYNSTNRTITLTGTTTAFWRGVPVASLVSGWTSPAHENTNGYWYLSYDGTNFNWSNTVWTFDQLQIAFVYFQTNDKFALRESHGLMPWTAHKEFHQTLGTYRVSGGTLSNYTLNSTVATNRRPVVSSCLIKDEDLETTNGVLNNSLYTKMYLSGASSIVFVPETAEIIPLSGNQPYWNEFTGGAWQQTLMANNSYTSVWLIAVPCTSDTDSQKYRYIWVQGQVNGTLAAQQARTPADVNLSALGGILTEFVFIAKIIILYSSGNWSIVSVSDITGNRTNQTTGPSGQFLSTVNHDATLAGSGTASDPLVIPSTVLASGVYTPTITPTANIASYGLYECQWMRVGSTVTVSGRLDIALTAPSVASQLRMSLPIVSDFVSVSQCCGTAYNCVAQAGWCIIADTTNNVALWDSSGITNIANSGTSFTFTYRIL